MACRAIGKDAYTIVALNECLADREDDLSCVVVLYALAVLPDDMHVSWQVEDLTGQDYGLVLVGCDVNGLCNELGLVAAAAVTMAHVEVF